MIPTLVKMCGRWHCAELRYLTDFGVTRGLNVDYCLYTTSFCLVFNTAAFHDNRRKSLPNLSKCRQCKLSAKRRNWKIWLFVKASGTKRRHQRCCKLQRDWCRYCPWLVLPQLRILVRRKVNVAEVLENYIRRLPFLMEQVLRCSLSYLGYGPGRFGELLR